MTYYELLANYGYGYETVTAANTLTEIKQLLKDYQLNDSYSNRNAGFNGYN